MTEAQRMPDTADEGLILNLRRRVKAPRERVFAAFTDPKQVEEWFGPGGVRSEIQEFDLRPGGRYRLDMKGKEGEVYPLSGVFREITPPEKLVYTWTWQSGEIAGMETLVTFEFHDQGAETEVVLTHERLPTETARERHSEGWTGSFDCLEMFVATGADV